MAMDCVVKVSNIVRLTLFVVLSCTSSPILYLAKRSVACCRQLLLKISLTNPVSHLAAIENSRRRHEITLCGHEIATGSREILIELTAAR